MAVHERLAGGRWMELTLMEQLANVGSEVDRAIRAAASGRVERRDRAIERALELFDLTAADDRWRGPPRREVLRAREEFCTLLLGSDAIPAADSAASLSRYFLYFAVAARRAAQRA
jgi:hypothetical protein